MRQKVLIIDDDTSFSEALEFSLKREKVDTCRAASPSEAIQIYQQNRMNFDLLLIDYRFTGLNISGSDLALKIRQINPSQSIIFMTGFTDFEPMAEMLQTGVGRGFIKKGDSFESLMKTITGVLKELRPATVEIDTLEDEIKRSGQINILGMVGRSKALYDLALQVEKLRKFQSRFLIIGDSGTGKELIAKAFAKNKKFYAVDCSGFDKSGEQFLESQLFGRKKGAYTGADTDMIGAFEAAKDGVIFLDELHCLSLSAQSKLLRVLQEQRFRRMGDPSGREISFEAVVVAATQPLIFKMLDDGSFKQDLYFRLARQKLIIPSLSERPDDIRPLAEYFFRLFSSKYNLIREPHPQLLRDLEAYSWPGNVRELEGCIDSMVMNSNSELITPERFGLWLAGENRIEIKSNRQILNLELVKDTVETEKIVDALSRSFTISEAAEKLTLARTTLNDRMKRLSIQAKNHLGTSVNRQIVHS